MTVLKTQWRDALWMCSALLVALFLAAGVFVIFGLNGRGVHIALELTARLQFLMFWPAYVGSALVFLFGQAFKPLKQHAREFGLAFSSALLVHLFCVGMLCSLEAAPPAGIFFFFGIAAAWAFLLALFSFARPRKLLGPMGWRFLTIIGTNYLAFAFLVDFWKAPFDGGVKRALFYLPFLFLAVAGPCLRLAAFVTQGQLWWRDTSHFRTTGRGRSSQLSTK